MIGRKAFGLVALATGVVSAPAKRQAPSGVPDYVLKYGKYTPLHFHTECLAYHPFTLSAPKARENHQQLSQVRWPLGPA